MGTDTSPTVNKFQKMVSDFPDAYPSRMGLPWDDQETLKLLKSVRAKQTIQQMAFAHERTVGAISAKLKGLACDYYFNENRPVEEIVKFTGLDKDSILDAISKKQYQMNMKEKKQETKKKVECKITDAPNINESLSTALLIEIRDLLKELLEVQRGKI